MKLYAIRDRMIDYFMVPFPAPNDNEAMAGISQEVNRIDGTAAIHQSPHHFELFLLGEVDENGTIFPRKELVCDCGNLVRPRRETTESQTTMAARPAQPLCTETSGGRGNGSA